METFALKPKLYFGDRPLEALSPLAGKRVLLVTDAFLVTSGLIEPVRNQLAACTIEIFDRVEPDPSLALVARGIQVLRSFGPDAVIAFGGGSPMDCAKAMVYFTAQEGGSTIPLYCIPTTAGTGSEVSSFAVLTDTEKGVKYPLVDDALLAEAAILEPDFLKGVPPRVTADTGMDVLTHAAEALVAAGANPFTDALAERAFTMAYGALPEAYKGNDDGKAKMLYASCMAGIAFNAAGLGVCHSMAHSIGGRFHVAHGRLNALLLPQVILLNAAEKTANEKYERLAKLCGLSPHARALSAALVRLRTSLGIPDKAEIPQSEMKAALPSLAAAALADVCLAANPRQVNGEELMAIMKELAG